MKNLTYYLFSLLVLFLVSACNQSSQKTTEANNNTKPTGGQAFINDANSAKNILQVALGSPDHTTLVAGVQAAELENVLANNGPLTVFAPTNAAFDALPEGVLDDLLKPENKSKLASIITFHASPGTYKGKLLRDGMSLFQATGHNVKITIKDGKTFVQDAEILATVDATNGVVHVIDKVLLPPE